MEKSLKTILFSVILIGSMALAQIGMAQAPPPPPADKGTNTNKAPGGTAPIDSGIYIAVSLVAGFGAWKTYRKLRKV